MTLTKEQLLAALHRDRDEKARPALFAMHPSMDISVLYKYGSDSRDEIICELVEALLKYSELKMFGDVANKALDRLAQKLGMK